MEILVVKNAGFCFGVKRAINIAFEEAKKAERRVYTLGPIIHNPQVVEKLKKVGVEPIDTPTDDADAILIRTHGVSEEVYKELQRRKIEIIDATCPFVKKAQQYAKLLRQEGYQVIILGDKTHPEVKGILSYAGKKAIVVKDVSELPAINKKVGVVVQTTQPIDALSNLVNKLVKTTKELKVYNTICNSTAKRLKETKEIAKQVDTMVVVGGKNSANTKQLTKLCEELGVKTFHVEKADELHKGMFKGVKKVGVTAGASTPQWIIKEVIQLLK